MHIPTFGGQRDVHDASTNFGADALLSLLATSSVKNLINLIFRRRKNHICYYKMISTTRVYYNYFS